MNYLYHDDDSGWTKHTGTAAEGLKDLRDQIRYQIHNDESHGSIRIIEGETEDGAAFTIIGLSA